MSKTVRNHTGGIVLSFLTGAATGAVVALLTAPQSGRDTRRKLKHITEDLADKAARVPPALQAAYRRATEAGQGPVCPYHRENPGPGPPPSLPARIARRPRPQRGCQW